MSRTILVVAEAKGGSLRQVSYEAIGAARTAAGNGGTVAAVIIGADATRYSSDLAPTASIIFILWSILHSFIIIRRLILPPCKPLCKQPTRMAYFSATPLGVKTWHRSWLLPCTAAKFPISSQLKWTAAARYYSRARSMQAKPWRRRSSLLHHGS